jgi:TIR domain
MSNSKIFFSYTREDSEFALQLATELRSAGADIWMDQLDIKAGTRWDVEVEKALHLAESILVILTPDSVSSHNVSDEISFAIDENKMVIPVLMKVCKIPFRLRRLQYADFTKEYKKGFRELLKALDLNSKSNIKSETEQSESSKPVTESRKTEIKSETKKPIRKNKEIIVQNIPDDLSNTGTGINEEMELLKFEGVDYSYDRIKNLAIIHGNLIVNSHSLQFQAVNPNNSFLIRDITKIRYLQADQKHVNNYMEVSYQKDASHLVIYFMHFTFFTEKPTLNMVKLINELISQGRFKLVRKK